jgi:hypothetical protein
MRSSLETNPTTRVGLLVQLRLALSAAGGTSVPGWFGPRTLSDVRDPGLGLVSCGDSEGTLLLEFGAKGMEWTVTKRGKDGIKFRIALAPRVVVGGRGEPRPLTLTRGAASLTVTGMDAMTDSDEGCVLEAAVGSRATQRLVLSVGGR